MNIGNKELMDVDWKVLLYLRVMGLENDEMEEMFWKWN